MLARKRVESWDKKVLLYQQGQLINRNNLSIRFKKHGIFIRDLKERKFSKFTLAIDKNMTF